VTVEITVGAFGEAKRPVDVDGQPFGA